MTVPESMRVLVVSPYFSPEMGAPAARFHDFGRLLVERGHRVSVVTGFPHFPSMRIAEDYRGRVKQREWIDGIEVLRGWVFASPRRPALSKSLGYASFAASASLWGMLGGIDADVVIATSPPPTVAVPGYLISRFLRAPLLFDVRDIWPEAIVESGRVDRGPLVRSLESLERFIYRASTAVTVVTEGKRERLLEKGVPEEKLAVIPNGVELGRFQEDTPVDEILRSAGVERDRFLVLYAGIFGPSQGLDVLFDAAIALRDKDPELAAKVQFVLVGAGVEKERLEQRRRQEGLEEAIVFVPEQPKAHIPSLLRAADAIAVTLRARKDTHTVPSKIYESIASGRPVLVSANGAPGEILEESGGGLASAAGDAETLAGHIERLRLDPGLAASLGEAGARYARHFDRRRLVERFEQVLRRCIERR